MSAKSFSGRLSMLSLALAAVCLAALLGGTASAALLSYEPFIVGPGQYTAGPLGGQGPASTFYAGPWVQAGGDSTNVDQGGPGEQSLLYPDFPWDGQAIREQLEFGCCTFGRNGRELLNPLGLDAGTSVIYNSFLIDFGDQGTDNPADGGKQGYEMWLGYDGNSPDGDLAVDFFFNSFSGVNQLTLSTRGFNPFEDPLNPNDDFVSQSGVVGAGFTRADLDLPNNSAGHLVVLKFEFREGNPDPNASLADSSDDDIVSVFLNPTSSLEGTPDLVLNSPLSNLIITHHSAYSHFTFSGSGHNPGAIDEIRFGETFEDVTPFIPEPASLTLAGLSVAGILLSRRRK